MERKQITPDRATFVVNVYRCENASWQGSVQWVEGEKKQDFRSELELFKLLDSAITKSVESPLVGQAGNA